MEEIPAVERTAASITPDSIAPNTTEDVLKGVI